MQVEATATPAVISAFGAQSVQGTLWDILRQFLDVGPWTELFIEDRPDNIADPKRPGGVVLVYRNNPFKDLDPAGGFIMPTPIPPDTLTISDVDIIGINCTRSDANVASYFQVNMPRFGLIDAGAMALTAQSSDPNSFLLSNYPNATPKLYGMRFMEANTELGGADGAGGRVDGQRAERIAAGKKSAAMWIDQRRADLMAMNKDNVVFESGTMTLRGRATLRPGMYLKVRHGPQSAENVSLKPFSWECYVVSVDHRMIPFQGYVTIVTFERGTGFAERIRRAGGAESAYLAEWNQDGAGFRG
jgi:hypothetical protein